MTICTHERKHLLGEVIDSEMRPSATGTIVRQEWLLTETIRPNVSLD
ncbi:MAG TPA: hypothetical protein VJL07_00380 [Dehalococcoidia bacterium]|nr:hypothetical protein [Dehalococcoidia bacterium]